MRLLVISDTHGIHTHVRDVIKRVQPDLMYHLGDAQGMEDELIALAGCPCECVRGNCDWGSSLPAYVVTTLGSHRVFITHGHMYDVKFSMWTLVNAAKEKDCDVAMYGHTHYPALLEKDGVTILNPGSISLPRQPGREPSFAVCDVDNEGELHFNINYLKEEDYAF